MARRKSKTNPHERWTRTVAVTAIRARVSTWAAKHRGQEPGIENSCSLYVLGTLDVDVNGVRDAEIFLHPEDEVRVGTVKPPAVGAIIDLKPYVHAVASFNHLDFDRLWALALSGLLKFVHLVFTKPDRSGALVTSVSFSTEQEE